MKFALVGSRSVNDMQYFVDFVIPEVEKIAEGSNITVISGGAKGVDTLAKEWAYLNHKDFVMYKPYHLVTGEPYSPKYFFSRNKQIVDNSDCVVCLYDGKSTGTADVIRYAKKRGKHLIVIGYPIPEIERSQ